MGRMIQIRVDESLKEILEKVQKDVAIDLKKKYKLDRVTLHGTIASQIIAAQYKGQKVLRFEIDKIGLREGILRLL
jgi:cytosine/adenosine deaminase-related metal-dependent hydrolase